MIRTAGVVALFILAGCARGSIEDIAYLPPDSYLRPYDGTTIVTPQDRRSPHLSQAETKPTLHLCWIKLPVDEAQRLRRCLFLIELGGCNGAVDVNGDPRRRVVPLGYERTCATYNWLPIYERLAPTARWIGLRG